MNLEKDLMLAFYMVHKLLENHRIPDEDGAIPVVADSYPSGEKVNYLKDTKNVSRSLKIRAAEPVKLKLRVLANKIIHSYLIVPHTNENEDTRVVICSDFEHNKRLFSLLVSDLSAVLKRIGGNPN